MGEVHKEKAGLYERSVQSITEWAKPYLHQVSQRFVEKSVDEYARDNPRFARMIEFEVRRRGDGAGLTQDVAEPLVWIGIKTVAAVAIAALTHSLEKQKFKMIGYGSALGLVLNNAVELFRLVPRYKAGLQGSLEMAKDRELAVEKTGIDPFNNQQRPREINKGDTLEPQFTQVVQKQSPIASTSFTEMADRVQSPDSVGIK